MIMNAAGYTTARLLAAFPFDACSHDARRANPLDPRLTAAVVLQVALDDTNGTANAQCL